MFELRFPEFIGIEDKTILVVLLIPLILVPEKTNPVHPLIL
jgi:hypothetical protein